jgi:N4-gp56 family major capsid protein
VPGLQTTLSAGLAPEMKTFYDRVLLERALPVLLHSQFGQTKTIPSNAGKIIEFRRFAALATATTPLTEGQPPTLKDLTVTAITATIAQYGDAVGFSDLVATTTIDPILTETSALLGEEAGQTIDEIYRDILVTGTTVAYTAGSTRVGLAAGNVITVLDIRKAVRTLVTNRAKKINGYYQAIIHPRVAFDIQSTAEWVTANQYAQTNRQFDGSLGELYGVKFWVSDKAKVFTGAGAGGIDVYASLFFGQNAYGVIQLDQHSLQSYFKPKGSAGTADPIDQQQTMGWKVSTSLKILNEAYMLRLESSVS